MQNVYHYHEAAAGGENDWTNPQLPFPARGVGAGDTACAARGSRDASHKDEFPCLYPGCFAAFNYPWILHEHSKVHVNYEGSCHAHQPPANPLEYHDFNSSPSNYNAFSGFNDSTLDGINDSTLDGINDSTLDGINDSTLYGLNDFDVDALADSDFDFTKFTQEVNQTPFLGHYNTLHPPIGATEEESPLSATPGTSLPPSHRFSCRHCATTCARRGDLRSHELKHRRFKAFDCPNHGCLRKGDRAFERKDKMESHRRVCRAGATAAQSED